MYDLQVSERKIRDRFRRVLNEYESFFETARLWNVGIQARKQTQVQLAIVAANVGITSKVDGYQQEVEWRSTVLLWDPVIPEVTDGGKRFLPIHFRSAGKRLILEEVIVCGPDPIKAQAQAREILIEAGYQGEDLPPIRLSEHSLRR